MPSDSTLTRKAILESAKKEFLANGFADAHLREIVAGAGVTTGALYRHYRDKKALFQALVEPVRSAVVRRFTEQTTAYIDALQTEGMDPMWRREGFDSTAFAVYFYDHLDAFRLLFSDSGVGETFLHTLIELEVTSTMQYLSAAQKQGYVVRIPDELELHLLVNAQFTTVMELALHNVPREQGYAYLGTINRFFVAAWKAVLLNQS